MQCKETLLLSKVLDIPGMSFKKDCHIFLYSVLELCFRFLALAPFCSYITRFPTLLNLVFLPICVSPPLIFPLFERNVSSERSEARRKLRECTGLVDSLMYIVQSQIDLKDVDNKVKNAT